jgi:hypothetical protein
MGKRTPNTTPSRESTNLIGGFSLASDEVSGLTIVPSVMRVANPNTVIRANRVTG